MTDCEFLERKYVGTGTPNGRILVERCSLVRRACLVDEATGNRQQCFRRLWVLETAAIAAKHHKTIDVLLTEGNDITTLRFDKNSSVDSTSEHQEPFTEGEG